MALARSEGAWQPASVCRSHAFTLAIIAVITAIALKHLTRSFLILICLLLPVAIIVYFARTATQWTQSHLYRYPSTLHQRILAPAAGPKNTFKAQVTEAPVQQLFPDAPEMEEQFSQVISVLLVCRLHSWYIHISKRHLFPNTVEQLLRAACMRFKERFLARDVIGIAVRRCLPIITQHLADFHNAEASVKRLDTDFEPGSELEAEAIAQKYRSGRLHRAARIQANFTTRSSQQNVLREGIVPKILVALLPEDERSELVYTLLRELLACAVLTPLFEMLAEPDFWNGLIVLHAGQAIQERAKIKRFRSRLEEQMAEMASPITSTTPSKSRFSRRRKPLKLERGLALGDAKGWERVYRKIRRCSSLADLVGMRRELMALKQQVGVGSTPTTGVKHTSLEEAPLNKALALLESRVALLSGGQRQSYSLGSPAQMNLDQTLVHGADKLRPFLQDRQRTDLLDLLLQVHVGRQQTTGDDQLFKEDIELLCRQFIDSPVLSITDQERTYLRNYISQEPHDYDGEANEIMLAIARRAHRTLEQEDFPLFQGSDLYLAMILGENEPKTKLERDSSNDQSEEDEVAHSVEHALQDLLVPTSRPASPTKDLYTAEPGDLELAERIAQLEHEIKKRADHLELIEHLLAHSTTTTASELRVMQESQAQISAELRRLETQKAQFVVQQDEHDLYGRSQIAIESYVVHRDHEGEYTAYLIEVRRTGSDGTQAGWIIARRYSEFNDLYSRLKQIYPHVAHFDFPKKQLNRLKSVSESRRPLLESFLRNLLADERLCRSRELRAFLSQHYQQFPKKRHRSVLENLLTFTDPREGVARLFALLEGPETPVSGSHPDLREVHPPPTGSPSGMDDTQEEGSLSSFAKPIVNLILEAFDLRDRGKWIQKRAVVLVLQQILGGTLEGRVRDGVQAWTAPAALQAMLGHLERLLLDQLPGTQGTTITRRTAEEKRRTRELALATVKSSLPPYIPDTAAKKVFRALQNRTLNVHVLNSLADELVESVFT